MRRPARLAVFALAIAVAAPVAASHQSAGGPTGEEVRFPVRLADAATLAALRRGGLVLYLRHAPTDTTRADQAPVDLEDCGTQRPLSAQGRQVAEQIGQALRRARVPVGEIWASPMCRTQDTARLVFGARAAVRVEPLLMYTAHLTSTQKQPVLQRTRELLSAPVPEGTNRVLVGHGPTLADVMGYFVTPEGTLVVLQPRAGEFEYVASIPPAHWPAVLRPRP